MALCLAVAAPFGAALAATGTLDTGALTPQTAQSRRAAMEDNTGASARTKGGAVAAPPKLQNAPRESGPVSAGPAGMPRPMQ